MVMAGPNAECPWHAHVCIAQLDYIPWSTQPCHYGQGAAEQSFPLLSQDALKPCNRKQYTYIHCNILFLGYIAIKCKSYSCTKRHMHTTGIIMHETADMSADVYNIHIYIYCMPTLATYCIYVQTRTKSQLKVFHQNVWHQKNRRFT